LQTNILKVNQGKEHIGRLAGIMAAKGVVHVVVSPGSRNAPAIILFSRNGKLFLTSIADERSAGFFALGMALQLNQPVALLCTSGSAPVNYGPAVSEAFYQKIPLLVISADRPAAWIDQGDGQTIRQERLFANFIRKSYNLPETIHNAESQWHFDRIVNEAIDYTRFPVGGPVHLNLPLAEPLYDIDDTPASPEVRIIGLAGVKSQVDSLQIQQLAQIWNSAGRKMILAGQLPPDPDINQVVGLLAEDPSVVVLTETTSNLKGERYIECIDRVIEGLSDKHVEYAPEILLTFGGAVVSKKIKALLRKMKPPHHWHINSDTTEFHLDTYQSLTLTIASGTLDFLRELRRVAIPVESSFSDAWGKLNIAHKLKHDCFLGLTGYSDLKVYEMLFDNIPDGSHIHLANSTPVRYAQLFDHPRNFRFWSNRGTSGIDGCVSTAVGAASVNPEPLTVITGDIGFFYDSNALWNQHLPANLRIVLINNGGGNIFRVLPGPDRYAELGPYLETSHSYNARGISENFGVDYFMADQLDKLQNVLPQFYQDTGKTALLEIVTPAGESAETIRNYFKYMIE
jgi:2-succinyl-5-enolpyruvyl-6-hydroxy-3-cyclohexene-1-carboxylate synthase